MRIGKMSELSQFGISEDAYLLLKRSAEFDLGIPASEVFQQRFRHVGKEFRSDKVAILMCTYDGQCYVGDQLKSLASQTHENWNLWVSDDGSQDGTHAILTEFQVELGPHKVSLLRGPSAGFAANFLSLVCKPDIEADYYAYSDQDDIWEPEKLERAIEWLKSIPKSVPALYCSRTRLIDVNNKEIGFSPLFKRKPSFANALMQNIGGGNSMVFNNAARSLLLKAGEDLPVITHDWWTYMVISGCGGQVFYDSNPWLRYRQHQHNVVGANCGWLSRVTRFRLLWKGRFRSWNDANLEALSRLKADLTPENRKILDHFVHARQGNLVARIAGWMRCGVYRQTLFGNLALAAAIVFKKM
jgi:glycosyltransferase involved in cell wall biosynthesis